MSKDARDWWILADNYFTELGSIFSLWSCSFPDENLKVPHIVHFTWFYKNVKDATAREMKFYQLISLLAAYKKIRPQKIFSKYLDRQKSS